MDIKDIIKNYETMIFQKQFNNDINYIYVMDCCQCAIYEIELDGTEDDDIERLLKEYGLDIDDCDYMYSRTKLNIETINKK